MSTVRHQSGWWGGVGWGGAVVFSSGSCRTSVTAVTRCPRVPPQDVQYSDIDYMERQLDFTLSPKFAGFPALITRMKADGMRVILILVRPCENGTSVWDSEWARVEKTYDKLRFLAYEVEVQKEKYISQNSQKLCSSGGS